jgi:hypothetical protein
MHALGVYQPPTTQVLSKYTQCPSRAHPPVLSSQQGEQNGERGASSLVVSSIIAITSALSRLTGQTDAGGRLSTSSPNLTMWKFPNFSSHYSGSSGSKHMGAGRSTGFLPTSFPGLSQLCFFGYAGTLCAFPQPLYFCRFGAGSPSS